jgi:hypothetical protein
MSDITLEHYGRTPRLSEHEIAAGLGMIRLLVPEQREAEFRRLAQRDRRYLMADLKWTALKLKRRCLGKGRLAAARQLHH